MKITKNILSLLLLFVLGACSSSSEEDPDPTPTPTPEQNVFERLQGSTFQQVEKTSDCATCEDEINYYIFSKDALQITGTTYEDVCEQNDIQPIGNCADCATVEENTPQKLTLCLGSLCQTITFLSDDEIQFDFPAAGETWTAQRYTEEPPCKDWDPVGDGEDTVLERLKGKTFQQIETVDTCGTCDDEKNYYMFLDDGFRITGTTLDDVCEQNDFYAFGDDIDIELNTTEELQICIGTFPFRFCQTITFLSENEIHFDFPAFNQTWTAQLYTEDVPCTDWAPSTNPFFTGAFDGAVLSNVTYDPFGATYLWPSSAQSWAGFANNNEYIYPLSFPNGGSVTFTAATSGVDIDVRFRIEYDVWPNVDPAYDTNALTISGTDPKEYTVEIPPQGSNTYSSMLFYLMTPDQELIVSSDFQLTVY
ncbi:MAG: hypothetical protein ACPF99_00670 [Flavobacteriaceae bacterium]